MKFLSLLIIFTITCIMPPASFAETSLTKTILPNNRVILITGHPDYPPVVWKTEDGKSLQGVAVELLEMILKEANIEAKFINVDTWGRAQEEVKSGRIDILVPPYKTEERKKEYSFPAEPFMMDETVIFVRRGNEFKFDQFDDLLKHPGVAIINDSFGSKFDDFEKKSKNLTRLATTEQCFRFVEKKRARYVIAGLNSGMAALTKLKIEDQYTTLAKRIIVTGLFAPVSMKSQWNIPEFNSYLHKKLEEYNRNGTVKALEKKYIARFKEQYHPKQKH